MWLPASESVLSSPDPKGLAPGLTTTNHAQMPRCRLPSALLGLVFCALGPFLPILALKHILSVLPMSKWLYASITVWRNWELLVKALQRTVCCIPVTRPPTGNTLFVQLSIVHGPTFSLTGSGAWPCWSLQELLTSLQLLQPEAVS